MMIDREKVVKGLEEVQHYIEVENLPAHTLKAKLVIDDALALLKAQEPVSPVTSEVQYGDHLQHCPSCGKALPNSGEYGKSYYCYKCGQAGEVEMTNETVIAILSELKKCYLGGIVDALDFAIEAVKAQEPRVMTIDEVKLHYNLPSVFPNDLGMQEDYYQDIQPLYFEFPNPCEWNVHWRNSDKVRSYLDKWEDRYNKTWRCWTSHPTDEQREATPWDL